MRKPKYKIGDEVHFTNDSGIYWGIKKITEVSSCSYSKSGFGYKVTPTDTPWFDIKQENLTLKRNKSMETKRKTKILKNL